MTEGFEYLYIHEEYEDSAAVGTVWTVSILRLFIRQAFPEKCVMMASNRWVSGVKKHSLGMDNISNRGGAII